MLCGSFKCLGLVSALCCERGVGWGWWMSGAPGVGKEHSLTA